MGSLTPPIQGLAVSSNRIVRPGSSYRGPAAISFAVGLDGLLAEPPRSIHPVALFGQAIALVDRDWPAPRLIGALAAICLPVGAAGLAASFVSVVDRRSPLLGVLAAGGVLFVSTSRRLLTESARAVVADSRTDLPAARRGLRALVGRDAATLSAGLVRSAAIESAAENLADGWCAPLFAFSLCARRSLSLAAGAVAWVKAVNTMDSMLGYRSIPTGWGAARLDDAVMWVPARLAALGLALAAGDLGALGRGAAWAHVPRSPNSGWPMATLAAILDARLEKPGSYVLDSTAPLPTSEGATAGIAVVDRAAILSAIGCCLALALRGRSIGPTDDRRSRDRSLVARVRRLPSILSSGVRSWF